MKLYAMEAGFLARLLSDRKELLAYARNLKTAEEMRAARDDLYKASRVYRTPDADHPLQLTVDSKGVAHIPIFGELTPSADPCGASSMQGETEYGFIRASIAAAEAAEEVSGIALDINSPGGYIDGVDLAAQAIANAKKPVTSYVDGMACSAAFWLAAPSDKIVALSPTAEIGSIGVACEEFDSDEHYAKDGYIHRVYTSTDAPDKRPDTKTPEGRAKVVAELDALHAVFVRRVSEGRHVSAEKVSKDFGRGGVFTAEKALAVGMIDEVRGSHLTRIPAGVAGSAAAEAAISQQEGPMDQELLKAEYDKGVQAGIEKERARVAKLQEFKGLSAQADQVIEEAVASGAEYNDIAPKLTAAAAKGRVPEGDNPPTVKTQVPDTPSGSFVAPEGMSIQDVADLRKAGMTDAEIMKYGANAGRK